MLKSVTLWIILINVGAYLFLGTKGVSLSSPSPDDLIIWGGNLGPFTLTGEYGRLLTSMFLHAGPLHLILNMFMLVQIGAVSEAAWGKVRFLGIYLFTGLFAGLASAYWYSSQALNHTDNLMQLSVFGEQSAPTVLVSVGASGALMGMAAALLVHALKEKEKASMDWKIILQVVLLNLGMGFFQAGVDNACHVGGALSGFIMGGLLVLPWDEKFNISNKVRSAAVFAVSALVLAAIAFKPASDDLKMLSEDLKISFKELENLEQLKLKNKKQEEIALAEAKTIPIGVSMEEASGKSITFLGGAADLIGREGDPFFYIPTRESNGVVKIDLKNFTEVNGFKGPVMPVPKNSGCRDNVCMGRGAAGIAVSKDGKWGMASSMVPDSVSKFDFETGKVLWSVDVGRFPRNIFLSDNEKYAYVVNSVDNSISVVNIELKKTILTKPIGGDPAGLPFGRFIGAAKADGRVFFADPVGNKIVSIETENPRETKNEIHLESFSPNKVVTAPAQNKIWVSGTGGLRSYDLKTFKLIDQFKTCGQEDVTDFAVSSDGKWIALEQYNNQIVRIISVSSSKTVRVFPSSSGYNIVRFADDAKGLYMLSMQGAGAALSLFDVDKTLDVEGALGSYGEAFCF